MIATNVAKKDIDLIREGELLNGTTTTFVNGVANLDTTSWKTTVGSISDNTEIKKIKLEYSTDGIQCEKTVNAEEYDFNDDAD